VLTWQGVQYYGRARGNVYRPRVLSDRQRVHQLHRREFDAFSHRALRRQIRQPLFSRKPRQFDIRATVAGGVSGRRVPYGWAAPALVEYNLELRKRRRRRAAHPRRARERAQEVRDGWSAEALNSASVNQEFLAASDEGLLEAGCTRHQTKALEPEMKYISRTDGTYPRLGKT